MSVLQKITDDPIRIISIDVDTDVDDEIDEDSGRFTRVFTVRTNDTRTECTIFDVEVAEPRFRKNYTFADLRVVRRKLTNTDCTYLYRLEVEFEQYTYQTPYLEPIDWQWETAFIEVPAYIDAKKRPIVTDAGEPIAGLKRRVKLWIARGTRKVANIPDWVWDYGVSVNKDVVKIDGRSFNPDELQLQRLSIGSWDSIEINKRKFAYRPLDIEIWFNPLTWRTPVLNQGFVELVERTFTDDRGVERTRYVQVRCTNADGTPTDKKVFLNASGQRPRNDDGSLKQPLEPADIRVLKFDLDDALPYKPLVT